MCGSVFSRLPPIIVRTPASVGVHSLRQRRPDRIWRMTRSGGGRKGLALASTRSKPGPRQRAERCEVRSHLQSFHTCTSPAPATPRSLCILHRTIPPTHLVAGHRVSPSLPYIQVSPAGPAPPHLSPTSSPDHTSKASILEFLPARAPQIRLGSSMRGRQNSIFR